MAKNPPNNELKTGSTSTPILTCVPKRLGQHLLEAAAKQACEINPQNNAPLRRLAGQIKGYKPTPLHIALVTSKYWGPEGVRLSVSFLESASAALRTRILSHMNAWAQVPTPGAGAANVRFMETQGTGDVRIAFQGGKNGGYWSYIGTDIRSIALDEQTMNLEAFTVNTPDREFVRVVRHETGHTLGFPHGHMRRALVNRIDAAKAIAYFGRTQGWSPDEVRAQVLTPLEESSIMGTARADQRSIMCYEIPGEITKSGKPIIGGTEIDAQDYAFAAKIYPTAPPPQASVTPAALTEGSGGGDGAATIQIATGGTRIVVSVPGRAGASTARSTITGLATPLQPAPPLRRAGTPGPSGGDCTLDTVDEVEAVVIAALQLRFPHQTIETTTKLDDDLGMTPETQAVLLPGMMREATDDGGCRTRLGSGSYRTMKKVQDIIDAIWADLQDKCDL